MYYATIFICEVLKFRCWKRIRKNAILISAVATLSFSIVNAIGNILIPYLTTGNLQVVIAHPENLDSTFQRDCLDLDPGQLVACSDSDWRLLVVSFFRGEILRCSRRFAMGIIRNVICIIDDGARMDHARCLAAGDLFTKFPQRISWPSLLHGS